MRNFPKLQLSNFFLQFSKKKYSYLWGGFCGGNFEIYHANQQFSTCMLIDTHVNKRERYTISSVHDCACYCTHTCLLMLIKIQIENTQSTLESKTSHLWEYLKSYKSIKRTAQLKTFKLTLQQLFHCSNKKYQTMFNGKWKQI